MKDRLRLKRWHYSYIIIDEGHRMKNAASKLAATLLQYEAAHRILLTGTPLQNSLTELWALLNFLLPKIFASSDTFEAWFSAPLAAAGGGSEDAAMTEEESLLVINRLHQVPSTAFTTCSILPPRPSACVQQPHPLSICPVCTCASPLVGPSSVSLAPSQIRG